MLHGPLAEAALYIATAHKSNTTTNAPTLVMINMSIAHTERRINYVNAASRISFCMVVRNVAPTTYCDPPSATIKTTTVAVGVIATYRRVVYIHDTKMIVNCSSITASLIVFNAILV